jgi:hypothetical protein
VTLYSLQHEFSSNRSCVAQLLQVLHDVGPALDTGREIYLIYLDFANAFDSVLHSVLVSFGLMVYLVRFLNDLLIIFMTVAAEQGGGARGL